LLNLYGTHRIPQTNLPKYMTRLLYKINILRRRGATRPSRDSHLKGDTSKPSHGFCTNYCGLLIPFALFTALFSIEVFAADSLPPHHADLSETSVSGVSSGGYMAVQFHVAYSGLVSGVGVIAGGPYNCADDSIWRATHNCMHPDRSNPVPEVGYLVARTDGLAASGDIDHPSHLANAKVWLFSGTQDKIVSQSVMDVLEKYYEHYVTHGRIFYKQISRRGMG
jgi:hypothetical protein